MIVLQTCTLATRYLADEIAVDAHTLEERATDQNSVVVPRVRSTNIKTQEKYKHY